MYLVLSILQIYSNGYSFVQQLWSGKDGGDPGGSDVIVIDVMQWVSILVQDGGLCYGWYHWLRWECSTSPLGAALWGDWQGSGMVDWVCRRGNCPVYTSSISLKYKNSWYKIVHICVFTLVLLQDPEYI